MSPGWIGIARDVIVAALRGSDLSTVTFSLSEEFTEPPEHLRRPGRPTIGFSVRLDHGRVEVTGEPDETAAFRVISVYADALPLARDPDLAAADHKLMSERIASGRLKVIGNPADVPLVLQGLDIHRLLAPHTA